MTKIRPPKRDVKAQASPQEAQTQSAVYKAQIQSAVHKAQVQLLLQDREQFMQLSTKLIDTIHETYNLKYVLEDQLKRLYALLDVLKEYKTTTMNEEPLRKLVANKYYEDGLSILRDRILVLEKVIREVLEATRACCRPKHQTLPHISTLESTSTNEWLSLVMLPEDDVTEQPKSASTLGEDDSVKSSRSSRSQ